MQWNMQEPAIIHSVAPIIKISGSLRATWHHVGSVKINHIGNSYHNKNQQKLHISVLLPVPRDLFNMYEDITGDVPLQIVSSLNCWILWQIFFPGCDFPSQIALLWLYVRIPALLHSLNVCISQDFVLSAYCSHSMLSPCVKVVTVFNQLTTLSQALKLFNRFLSNSTYMSYQAQQSQQVQNWTHPPLLSVHLLSKAMHQILFHVIKCSL